MLVIPLRVRDQQALQDAADRGLAGPDQQMKMIREQAIAVQFKRLPLLQFGQGLQERLEISLLQEHRLAIVAAVDDMVDQAVIDRSRRARHGRSIDLPRELSIKEF